MTLTNIFVENKYSKWYFNIVNRAKFRNPTGYIEKHHVIPRSAGGDDNINNIVSLTAKEHFICHLLLAKCTTGNIKYKMVCAVNKMLMSNQHQQRYAPTATQYQIVRENFARLHSEHMVGRFVGDKHHSFGKTRTPEYREKISKSLTGRPLLKKKCEFCDKEVSAGPYKKYHGLKCKENKNISEVDLNSRNKTKKKICPHCNREIEAGSYSRWHGNNCKVLKEEHEHGKN